MPTISLLFNIDAQATDAILAWVKKKNATPTFIVDDNNPLKLTHFPHPLYLLREIISVDSSIEEGIYQRCHHYRQFFSQKFPFKFDGINLLEDELRNYNFELAIRYLAAYLTLASVCESVVIAISYEAIYFRILLQGMLRVIQKHQLGKLDDFLIFNPKKNRLEPAKTSFYGYHGKLVLTQIWNRVFSPSPPLPSLTSAGAGRGKEKDDVPPTPPPHVKEETMTGLYRQIKRREPEATEPLPEQASHGFLPRTPEPLPEQASHGFLLQPPTPSPPAKPCFLITTPALLYRTNFTPVYKAACERLGKKPLAIAVRADVEKTAKEDGIDCIALGKKQLGWLSVKFALTLLHNYPRWLMLKFIYLFNLNRKKLNKNLLADIFRSQMITFLAHNGLMFRLSQSALNTKKLDNLLSRQKPSVIYKDVSRSLYDNRLAELAKKYEIPVVASVVASISSRYRNFGIYPCDFITLLGESQKTILKKHGFADTQIICVGQPELDTAKKIWNFSASHTYLSKLISDFQPGVFTILIATGYIDLVNEKKWITALCKYAEQCTLSDSPIRILLKPHPSLFGFYETLSQLPCLTLLPPQTLLYPCLVAANLVVTDVSHAGKLAIFFEKALLVINFSGKPFPFNRFDEENVAWLATTPEEIYRIIDGVRSDTLRIESTAIDNYIRRHLTSKDGKAADRIVDFLFSFSS